MKLLGKYIARLWVVPLLPLTMLLAENSYAGECDASHNVAIPEMCSKFHAVNGCRLPKESIGKHVGIAFYSMDDSLEHYFLSEIQRNLDVAIQEIQPGEQVASGADKFELIFIVTPYLGLADPIDSLIYSEELEGSYYIGDEGFPGRIPNVAKRLSLNPCEPIVARRNLSNPLGTSCDAILLTQATGQTATIVLIGAETPEVDSPKDMPVRRETAPMKASDVRQVVRACLASFLASRY